MSILIKNGYIVTQNKKRQQIAANIFIEDQIISEISKQPINTEADFKIDGQNKLIMPGLINTHTHLPMTLMRGYGDDMELKNWLNQRIWPIESKLTNKSIEFGSKLALLEMIATGTTSFIDMYFFENKIAEITEKVGMRGFLGFAFIDFGTPEHSYEKLLDECEKFVKIWGKNKLITPVIAPHSTYTCNPETLQKTKEIALKYDSFMHIHCSETRDEIYDVEKKYGYRPVELLKKYGLLYDKMVLAHCGWITKNEILDIKKGNSKVSHNPVSNMKIATGGFTPIPEILNSNITIGLGTDGAASNNCLDMFETMKFCSLIHKHHRWDPTVLPAQSVVDFATIGGSECVGMGEKIGLIDEGKIADIIILDLKKPHFVPSHNLISHLVYTARGDDVSSTIVNGKPLMIEKKFITLDYSKTLENAEKCAMELIS
jgi:5-methylthioadenosine/S-adenosylhomocysteine deaminase